MSNSATGLTCKVLHIRSGEGDAVASIDALLAMPSFEVSGYPDVYTGLAALCRQRRASSGEDPALSAVLVCVDDLGPAEMEFFSIIQRVWPGLPTYVYGDERFASKSARAIERGAAGIATADVIRSLQSTTAMPAAVTTEFPAERDVGPAGADIRREPDSVPSVAEPVGEPVPSAIEPPPAPATAEPPADGVRTAKDAKRPAAARVPWLRYADRPVRTGPQRSTSVPPEDSQDPAPESKRPPARPHTPLLTEAELQALIGGDDIGPAAADEHTGSDSDDPRDGEGHGD